MLLVTSVASGQSAQATMEVSVRVVSGITATAEIENNLIFNRDGVSGGLGAVALSGVNDKQVLISNDREVELANDKGHTVTLPVELESIYSGKDLNFRLFGKNTGSPGAKYEGVYTGTVKTTIEYL